jgi:uncharacterized membrane protein
MRSRPASKRSAFSFWLGSALALAAGVQAQAFEFVDLGSLGGEHAAAHAVDESGLVTGASIDAQGRRRAFIKLPEAPMYGLLAELNGGNAQSEGVDVNARGEVLLVHTQPGLRLSFDLFLWSAAQGVRELGAHAAAAPVGLDDRGRIVINDVDPIAVRPNRWTRAARSSATVVDAASLRRTRLPELSENAPHGTTARGLNGRGDVVGSAPDLEGKDVPVLWEGTRYALEVLPTLPDPDGSLLPGRAIAISSTGTIVGTVDVPYPCPGADDEQAHCLTPQVVAWIGHEHTLTILGEGVPAAVNSQDVIVGDRIWDLRSYRVVPLLPAGAREYAFAYDIDDNGVIVGERGGRAVQFRYVP